jgi:glycosyltransferase involved in cell wall biosynthesis
MPGFYDHPMKLVVIIPALNEESNIGDVIRRIPEHIDGVDNIQAIVIDDGSKDQTVQVAHHAGARVISHITNQGVGQSFQTGLKAALEAGADIMVNIDGDGQFLPEEIPLLIRPILQEKADFVPADRFADGNGGLKRPEYMPPIKFWGNQLMSSLVGRLAGRSFNDVSCGFRAYSREAMLQLNLTGRFTYTQESFLDLSFKRLRIQPMPVTINYFPDRRSRVATNLLKYAFQTLNIILRAYRDYRPLQFFFFLGLVPFAIGIIGMIFMGIYFLNTGNFTPYKAVGFTSIYLFSLGLLLFITGFLADMFLRLRQNQERILYFEKRRYYDHK